MKTFQLETTSKHYCIPVPDSVPDGTRLRVPLLLDDDGPDAPVEEEPLKELLASLTEGLTDEDLCRPRDQHRAD